METDDKIRGNSGVAVSLRRLSDGKCRITLDDIENSVGSTSGAWQHRAFVTHKSYSYESLANLDLSESEFASFGHYILARLLAANRETI
jgi:hypothetical protein